MTVPNNYLARHAELRRWPLVAGGTTGVDQVVVIPVFAERDALFGTLESLAANDERERRSTLVICVVNNRHGGVGGEENQEVLARLKPLVGQESPLRMAYIDASSPGCEFDAKGGVGLARKIGMDWGLEVLTRNGCECGTLICLDADTVVEPDYLGVMRKALSVQSGWGGVVDYEHPLELPPEHSAAIVCYELFLRYHVMGLRWARSPYAFHTIGSAMACRAEAYVAVSGMKPRQAGEDFYFLQALGKTGGITLVHDTKVYPSARMSERVPFGTGARVRRHLAGTENEYLLYDPRCYTFLRDWFARVEEAPEGDVAVLLAQAGPLAGFLNTQDFGSVWPRLRANSRGGKQLVAQFHRWFDAFRTIKCLHYLRDNEFPAAPMFEALTGLLSWMGLEAPELSGSVEHDLELQKALLWRLRGWAAEDVGPRGISRMMLK